MSSLCKVQVRTEEGWESRKGRKCLPYQVQERRVGEKLIRSVGKESLSYQLQVRRVGGKSARNLGRNGLPYVKYRNAIRKGRESLPHQVQVRGS